MSTEMPQTESAESTNKPKAGGRRPRRGGRGRGRGRGRGGGATERDVQGSGKSGNTNKVNGGGRTRKRDAKNTEPNTGDTVDQALDTKTCPVCASEAKDWAVGECMHPVCSDCSHRMRVLYKRESCVLCNTLLAEVTVIPAADFKPDALYSSVRAQAQTFDEEVKVHFVKPERARELAKVRAPKCSACKYVAPTLEKLKQHVRSRHNSVYCLVCFNGGTKFVSELPFYPLTPDGRSPKLREHMKREHPQCQFCHTYFLTDDDLYAHLQSVHETCFICERQGRIHEYYENFQRLENHYRAEHFVCDDPGCRGVVFSTRVELQAHQVQHHMANVPRSARRIRVNLADFAPQTPSEQEVREEQARQAARRRAFAAVHANFVGSGNDSSSRNTNDRGHNANARPNEGRSSETRRGSSQNSSRPAQVTQRVPPPPIASGSTNTSSTSTSSSLPAPGAASAREGVYRPLPLPQTQNEAQERSQNLMRTMRSKLDPSAFEMFKEASAQFRDGDIDANEFYRATIDAFGVRQAIRDIFPELIALLPDAGKRALLTNALSGREQEDGVAPQSTIDFPSLEGQRPVAPSIMPTVRTHIMPVPSSGDFPSLGRSGGGGNTTQRQPPAQAMPQINLHRVFGGANTPTNLPEPRRTRRDLTNAFGPFPALGSTSRPPPPPSLRSQNVTTQPARGPESLYTSVATRPAPAPAPPPARHTRAPPPRPSITNNNTNDAPPLASLGRRELESPATAFPSLGVISAAMLAPERSGASAGSTSATTTTTMTEATSLDSDVTNRVGAPWGGNPNNSRRKRGPGGRTPAPPPPAVFGSSSSTVSGSGLSLTQAVREEELENRRRIERSALPKVGAGGFGFAWDRKNNQKKKKAIKTEVLGKGGGSGGAGPSAGGASA